MLEAMNEPNVLSFPEPEERHLWERRMEESAPAFEAFDAYRMLGVGRTLTRLSERLGKALTLLKRWASLHEWVPRARAWDRQQSRAVNERIVGGVAAMRNRQAVLAIAMQARAQKKLLNMSEEEIAALRPIDLCAMLRTGAELERRARSVPDEDLIDAVPELTPQFTVVEVRPRAQGMARVLVGDRWGYIPEDQVERFRAEYPQAVVIR